MNIQAASSGDRVHPGRTNQYAISAWKPLLVFMLFTIAITAGGYAVFQRHKESIKSDKQDELGGIAELKIRQITTWITERKGDAQALKDDPLFLSAVESWLQRGAPAGETGEKLAARMSSMQQAYSAYGYSSILLFDDQAVLRLSSSADDAPAMGSEKALLLESMRSGQIIFSDIHMGERRTGEVFEIDFVAPLLAGKNGRMHPIGAILFRVDPQRFLFPLIQRWPTPSASAENLLVRRDGDKVVFLNELRHRKNTALVMRLPLTPELPAAMAAMGQEGLMEGIDYRGIPVVGVLSKVPGTSWSMVSKIDKAEIYAPINQLSRWMLLLMLALVGTGAVITVLWRKNEKKQNESELQRQVLARHLDYIAKYANDIILLLDSAGRIIDFNDRAVGTYGYSAEDFSTLNISDLRAIDFTLPSTGWPDEENRAQPLRFESTHVRSNGESFPVEISMQMIDTAGEQFHHAIIRDITERKIAEEELTRQKDFIRQVIDSDPNLIFVKDVEGRFLLANEAMAKSYGQTTQGIIGKYNWELADNWELAGDREHLAEYDRGHREVIETRQARVALETGFLADGKSHWFQTIRKPLVQGDGSVSVLSIAMDVTRLKETEERLQANNRALRLLSACNMALVHIAEEGQLLAEVCKLIVELGGYRMAWIGFAEHDPEKNIRPVARYGNDDGYLGSANISWADTERGRGPIGIAIRTGTPQVNQNFLTNPLLTLWREAALARGYQSSIALPLKNESNVFGTLNIYSAEPDSFSATEKILLEELTDNLAWGIAALRMRTERKLAEAQLDNERTRLRTLVQTIPDMVWMKDTEGFYLGCNPQIERFYGAKEADIIGRTDYDFVDAGLADWFRLKDRETMAADKPCVNEEWIAWPDNGQRVLLETIKAPMRDDAGKLIGVMGIARDITERKQAEEREGRLRHILDNTLDMIFIFLPHSLRFVYVNKGAIDSVGYSNEELLLMTAPDIKPLIPEPEFRKLIVPLITGAKNMLRFETVHRHKNGTDLPVEVQLQLVQENDGKSVFVAIVRDMAERRRAETELQRQKTFMWQVIDIDPNRIFVKNAEGKFILVNQGAAAAHGLIPNEMIGKSLAEIKPSPEDEAGDLKTDREVIENGLEINLVEPYRLPNGEQRWHLTIKRRLTMPDKSLGVLCISVDITTQKLAEIKLAQSYRKLQQLYLHLENVKTEERAKIALYLHDEMGATLAATKMSVAWLASKLPPGMPQLASELDHLAELVTTGIRAMRQTVTQLNPGRLDEAGLMATIWDYVQKFQQYTEIECALLLPNEELALNADQSTTIFRIIQESLNNVVKHAQASEVRITLKKRGKLLLLAVEDNGIGFKLNKRNDKSFGLLGIRERALMVGGKARIKSQPGKGTKVSVSIPLSDGNSPLYPE